MASGSRSIRDIPNNIKTTRTHPQTTTNIPNNSNNPNYRIFNIRPYHVCVGIGTRSLEAPSYLIFTTNACEVCAGMMGLMLYCLLCVALEVV